MSEHTTIPTTKTMSTFLAVTVSACSIAAAALAPAPVANATCASFFGIGNGGGCTSTPTSIAIAIGTGAEAHAEGWFGTALAVGSDSFTQIYAGSFLDSAVALGVGVGGGAVAYGIGALSVAVGTGAISAAGPDTDGPLAGFKNPVGNVAINVSNSKAGNYTYAVAIGHGNTAVNLGGVSTGAGTAEAIAVGSLNTAANLFGTASPVYVNANGIANGWNANLAFNVFGTGNTVAAGRGPFAIAGAIFQTGAHVTKTGPGFNINGVKVGGTAAPLAAAVHTTTTARAKPASFAGSRKKVSVAAR
jgi:hypothetical protein